MTTSPNALRLRFQRRHSSPKGDIATQNYLQRASESVEPTGRTMNRPSLPRTRGKADEPPRDDVCPDVDATASVAAEVAAPLPLIAAPRTAGDDATDLEAGRAGDAAGDEFPDGPDTDDVTVMTWRRRLLRPSSLVAIGLTLLAVAWVSWLAMGGGLYWVGSPSMGQAAPVGSLVITMPVSPTAPIHVGQIYVFHPFLGKPTTYIHRIHAALGHGQYMTKGDLNQVTDPWVIARANIVGKPVAIIEGLGWVYKFATWLFLGSALLVVLSQTLHRRLRPWVAALGPALLVAVPLHRYHPLIGGLLYGVSQNGRHVTAQVVNTGALPVTFVPYGGPAVHALPGQEVFVHGLAAPGATGLAIALHVTMAWWGWLLVGMFCLIPIPVVEAHRRAALRHAVDELNPVDELDDNAADGSVTEGADIAGPAAAVAADLPAQRQRGSVTDSDAADEQLSTRRP
jgi:hypothetical protein